MTWSSLNLPVASLCLITQNLMTSSCHHFFVSLYSNWLKSPCKPIMYKPLPYPLCQDKIKTILDVCDLLHGKKIEAFWWNNLIQPSSHQFVMIMLSTIYTTSLNISIWSMEVVITSFIGLFCGVMKTVPKDGWSNFPKRQTLEVWLTNKLNMDSHQFIVLHFWTIIERLKSIFKWDVMSI